MKRKQFLTFRSFIMKLSQRIRLCSNDGSVSASSPREDTEFFHKTFPFFIWLLRDVTQSIPTDCRDIKEYFLTRQLILKRWTEMTKELIRRFPEKLFVTAAEILIISLFSRNRLLEFFILTKHPNVREHGFVSWL